MIVIFSLLPQSTKPQDLPFSREESIDFSQPRAFFDGAWQGPGSTCGGGVVLYLSQNHFFALSMGLGVGINNYAELMGLKLLMLFSIEQWCKSIQMFGDSMNVINWFNGTQRCLSSHLMVLAEEILWINLYYEVCSCCHVYKNKNMQVDSLSKEGIRMDYGKWLIKENREGIQYEFYH